MELHAKIPISDFKKFIINLAEINDVKYKKTGCDELAETFTNLSDDVVLDHVETLIIALERAGIIESKNVIPLHIGYLREVKNV